MLKNNDNFDKLLNHFYLIGNLTNELPLKYYIKLRPEIDKLILFMKLIKEAEEKNNFQKLKTFLIENNFESLKSILVTIKDAFGLFKELHP